MKKLVAALTLCIAGVMTLPSYAGANLVQNPSFETTPLPSEVVHAGGAVPGGWNQPVIPTGWAFEGATELFDHAAHAPGPKAGQYFVQISGSWSGPRDVCETGPCTNLPGGAQKDQAYGYYSVQPAWRNLNAIPVSAGTSYTFSAWTALTIPLDKTGAVARVRWVNAQGVPVGVTDAWKLLSAKSGGTYTNFAKQSAQGPGPFPDGSTAYTFKAANVTAPAGATGAILLLGYTDSAWIGGVAYDVVCFARVVDGVCTNLYGV
ncbi:MAG: hypothetical protein ABR548_10545 [Actinomycetota bacterium]